VDQVIAAREGLGDDGILCVDVGTVWGEDVDAASKRLKVLRDCRVTWLEEPFHNGALHAYRRLQAMSNGVKLAGGEGSHNEYMARHMIDYGGVSYIQIDAGRVGGITAAKRVADYADSKNVIYVNHTFTSHLSLSASIQPYAGLDKHVLCEYPVELKSLAFEMTNEHLNPDANGEIYLPERPGLGLTPDTAALHKYLVDMQIMVNGHSLYRTPQF
jgi:L-alanine-DL-glutamate epimerase-like enolase superfamily enzyme